MQKGKRSANRQVQIPTIEAFIASKVAKREIATRAVAGYTVELQRCQDFIAEQHIPARNLSDASPSDLKLYLSERLADSPASTSLMLAAIRGFFKFAKRQNYRPDNPTEDLELPKLRQSETVDFILSRAEMQVLLDAPSGRLEIRDRAMLYFFYCGAKKAEALSVSVHDVDLPRQRVRIGDRSLPLSAGAAESFAAYLQVRPRTKERALFLTQTGTPVGDRLPWQVVKKNALEVGLNDETSPETLRKSFAVHAIEDGVGFLEIMSALGNVDGPWLNDLSKLVVIDSKIGKLHNNRSNIGLAQLLHPKVSHSSLHHLENRNFREAVLNAMLVLTETIRSKSGRDGDGAPLVDQIFSPNGPQFAFAPMTTQSGRDEHAGFHRLLQGAYMGIRNPKSHRLYSDLTEHTAMQYLVFISLLVRRVEDAK